MLNDFYHMLDPVAISAGPITIYWYGLAYVVGALLTAVVMYRTQRRWGFDITVDDLTSVVVGVVFGLIIGARLFYVIFYGDGYYWAHPLEIFATNEGGMSFHGGLVGGIIGGALVCRMYKLDAWTIADLAVIGAPLALCLGRCANFVNGELWGKPTDLPWGVIFGGAAGDMPRHPSQLYEAFLEGIVLFCILQVLSRKKPLLPQGTFMGVFVMGYGIVRFLIEFVRVPDAQLGYLLGGVITMGQLLSLPLVIAGLALVLFALRRDNSAVRNPYDLARYRLLLRIYFYRFRNNQSADRLCRNGFAYFCLYFRSAVRSVAATVSADVLRCGHYGKIHKLCYSNDGFSAVRRIENE